MSFKQAVKDVMKGSKFSKKKGSKNFKGKGKGKGKAISEEELKALMRGKKK